MPPTLTQAQSVRARENWKRLRERYFHRGAPEPGSGSSSVDTAKFAKPFDERQQYGSSKNLVARLTGDVGTEQTLSEEFAGLGMCHGSNSHRPARFSVKRQKVQNYLWAVEEAIERNQQLPSVEAANFDKQLMNDLVGSANRKQPLLCAHHVIGPEKFAEKVKELVLQRESSFRIIVRDFEEGTHFAAFDVNNEGWRLSVVGIEPIAVGADCDNDLAPRCEYSLKEQMPDAAFLIVESEMQRSAGVCGMYCLFLVKTMFKQRDELMALHGDSSVDRFSSRRGRVPGEYLSPRFMKHAQSWNRVAKYMSLNRKRVYEEVNKRGETLGARYMRHWGEWSAYGGRTRSFNRSIEIKRAVEYKALLDAIDEENGPQERPVQS